MTFAAYSSGVKLLENWTVYGVGGGALAESSDNLNISSPEV